MKHNWGYVVAAYVGAAVLYGGYLVHLLRQRRAAGGDDGRPR